VEGKKVGQVQRKSEGSDEEGSGSSDPPVILSSSQLKKMYEAEKIRQFILKNKRQEMSQSYRLLS